MLGPGEAGSKPGRAAVDPLNAKQGEADAGAGNIDDGVNAADLVEMDVVDGRAVHIRLGLG
jgi:hypothetical protein